MKTVYSAKWWRWWLYNCVNTLNAAELDTLKWLVLCELDLSKTSIKNNNANPNVWIALLSQVDHHTIDLIGAAVKMAENQ